MRIQTRRQQIQELQGENRRLAKTQELLIDNMLALQQAETTYTGNRYKEYAAAVTEVAKKYSGQADYGVLQVGSIVDLRASYIIGQGIKVSKVEAEGEDAAREHEFAKRFIEANSLDHELPQDLAREAEIEGKTLIKLFPRPEEEKGFEGLDIILRWVSWTSNKYTVKVDTDDYLKLESVTWNPAGGSTVTLTPEKCVYKRFAGRLDIPNETMPRVAKCLTQIENLDQALRDWRQIDRFFAAPVPDWECDDAKQAETINKELDKLNWKIGKAFAHTGKFTYVQPSSDGQAAIEKEIITLMKLISGTTGVPIHFLGAPELTTKYGAASEGLLELISMSTVKEREVWRGAYQELIEKAMLMWNAETKKTALRPWLIKIELPVVTEAQWERITSTWLPLLNSKAITRKTALGQIPGLDAEAEIEALEAEDEATMEKFTNLPPEDVNEEGDEDAVPAPAPERGVTGQVLKYKSNPGNLMKKGEGK